LSNPQQISNWNGYPVVSAQLHSFQTLEELRHLMAEIPRLIPRGAGLSYGDASLAGHILSTHRFNRFLHFDHLRGAIRCEAGVTLDEILKVIVPKGWFLPVTPGTKYITIGGAVAADVHGKNHHKEGSIGRYVDRLTLMMADGELMQCSSTENPDLFHTTCGGMGLTGIILEVELNLKPIETSRIVQKNIIAPNLKTMIEMLRAHNDSTYSVAWIDCLARGNKMGRGVVMLGEHALLKDLTQNERTEALHIHADPKFSVPFELPASILNTFSISVFNQLFFQKHKIAANESVVQYDQFFYPLDFVKNWNRLYGRNGFLQYQFVIPFENGESTLSEIVSQISKSKQASFLSVLKLLGKSEHSMAFPMSGFTLSLDLPVSKKLFPLLDSLDELVAANGGRLYLAKDARMSGKMLARGYPALQQFKKSRDSSGASAKFESLLSKRLHLTE